MNDEGPRDRPGGPRRRGLRPTRPATLILAALVTAGFSWFGIRRYFGDLPNVTWLAGLTMAGLAVVEGIAAFGGDHFAISAESFSGVAGFSIAPSSVMP